MYVGVKVDESAKFESQLITTQSMPEAMCKHLNLNDVSYYTNRC